MKNPDLLWTDLVRRFAKQSTCLGRAVGAVIVKDGFVLGDGWNSPPGGCKSNHCPRPKCMGDTSRPSGSDLHLALCTHAEANAIANCAKRGVSLQNSSMYVSCKPCHECAKLIASSGITEVFYIEEYTSEITDIIFTQSNVRYKKLGG